MVEEIRAGEGKEKKERGEKSREKGRRIAWRGQMRGEEG